MAARHCFAIFVASLLIFSGCDATKVADTSDARGTSTSASAGSASSEAGKPEPTLADFPELVVAPTGSEGTAVGDTAPDIAGTDVDGKEFKLSQYRGKVVMLDFWGDW